MENLPNRHTGFWPTPDQQDLLDACLLDGDRARSAWHRWEHADIDNLDQGSFRLLPLLSRNLEKLGIDAPCLPKLRGVRRHFWVRNQVLFHHMGLLLKKFEAAGIRTLVLKGTPLSLLYYLNPGLRPMSDFDILIQPADRDSALALLAREQWKPIYFPEFADLSPSYLSFATSHGFRDNEQRELDLHWYLFPNSADQECDRYLWERAEPFALGDMSALTLAPTDHLLHICTHGAAWNEIPPIRWVADAVTVLRRAGDRVDWEALVEESERHRCGLLLHETLSYLKTRYAVSIPDQALEQLRNTSDNRHQQFLLRAQSTPLSARSFALEVRLLRQAQTNWVRREQVPGGITTFLKVMQHTAKQTSLAKMFGHAAKQASKRLRQKT